MATCSQCGSELEADDGPCSACGAVPGAPDRRAELKVDDQQLDEAPSTEDMPVPGDWGRADEVVSHASELAEVRQLRPGAAASARPVSSPRLTPADGSADGSEGSQSADVVYLPGADAQSPGETEASASEAAPPPAAAQPQELDASAAEAAAATSSAPEDAPAAEPAADTPEPVEPPSTEGPPPQDPDTIPDEVAEPSRPRKRVAPPLLASDALARELAPAEPHGWLARVVATLAAACGAWLAMHMVGTGGVGPALIGGFFGLGLLGVAPMPYGVRATALSVLASGGLSAALWLRFARGGERDEALLAAVVIVCSAALFFRSWHRGSMLARALVAVGIALGMGWLSVRGQLQQLGGDSLAWQSWAPHVLHLALVVLLLLSLLAFMDARTTGACSVWALGLLLWYAADVGVKWLSLLWPDGQPSPQLSRVSPVMSMAYLAAPLLAAVLSVSMAQLFAAARAVEPASH